MREGCLFVRLCDGTLLEAAWRKILGRHERSRVPSELRSFQEHCDRRLRTLAAQLEAESYLPEPASLLYIPKPDKPNERRKISVVKLEDRIVLTALHELL